MFASTIPVLFGLLLAPAVVQYAFHTDRIDALATGVFDLNAAILNSKPPAILMRLTILNKGATDGLVRHKGSVYYRGKEREMQRVPPPPADLSSPAVPVFQTNAADSDFAPQSVGKVEQDSMTEFWYQLSLEEQDDLATTALCASDKAIHVTLFDQNLDAVSGDPACNESNDNKKGD